MRYNVAPPDGEALYEEIQEVYKTYFHKPYVRPVKIPDEKFCEPAEIYRGFRFDGLHEYGFKNITMKLYPAARTFDADEYIMLLDTMSDHRTLPESDRAALYTGIKEAIAKHGGRYKVDYVFQLYMGQKP